jgi:hypothetical protein
MAIAPYVRRLGNATFRSDPGLFGVEVMKSAEMLSELRGIAEVGLAVAESVAAEHVVTGEFASSFRVHSGINDEGQYATHAGYAELVNTDPNAAAIEFGHADKTTGRHVDGVHALGRAAAAMDA